MTKHKKLTKLTWVVYILTLAVCLFTFWFLMGPDGGLGYGLIFELGLLGILVPFVLTLINSIIVGPNINKTLILPLIFGIGSLLCSFFTWNTMWLINDIKDKRPNVFEDFLRIQWNRFLFPLCSGAIALALGLAIWGLKKLIKNNKAKKIESAEN